MFIFTISKVEKDLRSKIIFIFKFFLFMFWSLGKKESRIENKTTEIQSKHLILI